jgi:alkyl hydroperoxide reductase subunit D
VAYVALATAYATKSAPVLEAALGHAQGALSDEEKASAAATASLMAMNNVYYRFSHLAENEALARLPAKLRMNHMGKPGVDKAEFELACLAVSALNGCGRCIASHVHELEKAGVALETIQWSARLAGVLAAAAQAVAFA